MRTMIIIISIAVVSLFEPAAYAQGLTEADMAMLKELREIRNQLMAIRADVAALKKASEDKPADSAGTAVSVSEDSFGGFQRRGANVEQLQKLKLPDNPTDEQIREYIRKIIQASQGQNSYSSDDLQVGMYAAIGAEHLNVLLGSMAGTGDYHAGEFHLQSAIKRMTRDSDKMLVLTNLMDHPFLISIVVDKGWEQDAKDIIVKGLAAPLPHLPGEWIEAVANLKDPKTYDDLKWQLIHEDNRYNTFEAIKDLPGINLDAAVAQIWTNTGYHEWEERGVAKIAMQFGHVDALTSLADYMLNDKDDRWGSTEVRRLLMRHIDFRGSTAEMAQWINKNAKQLVFDKTTRKYSLPAGASSSEQQAIPAAGSTNNAAQPAGQPVAPK